MKTPITEMFDIEFPIVAFTHCRDVVAAVSKAGGLGVLGVAGHSMKNLEMELEWIENEVGDKPYGVDLLLPTKFVGSDRGGFDASQLDERIPDEPTETVIVTGCMARQIRTLPEGLGSRQVVYLPFANWRAELPEGREIWIVHSRLVPGLSRNPAFVADWTGDDIVMRDNQLGSGIRAFEKR
jgi:hypothetical protein